MNFDKQYIAAPLQAGIITGVIALAVRTTYPDPVIIIVVVVVLLLFITYFYFILILLQEGVAIGRSFALATNQQVDGNKEMIAYGLMNIVGSMTSCYLTTGN